jgi:lysylphosphatidylglycerol synthetase-like protein (DUF2156 family)
LFVRIRTIANQPPALSQPSAGLVAKKPKTKWLAWIYTRQDALTTIRRVSVILFVFAGFYTLAFAVGVPGRPTLPDEGRLFQLLLALLPLGLGLWLRYGKSRIAAVILLFCAVFFSLFLLITSAVQGALPMMFAAGALFAVPFLCLSVPLLYAGAKAVEATFKLHSRFKSDC